MASNAQKLGQLITTKAGETAKNVVTGVKAGFVSNAPLTTSGLKFLSNSLFGKKEKEAKERKDSERSRKEETQRSQTFAEENSQEMRKYNEDVLGNIIGINKNTESMDRTLKEILEVLKKCCNCECNESLLDKLGSLLKGIAGTLLAGLAGAVAAGIAASGARPPSSGSSGAAATTDRENIKILLPRTERTNIPDFARVRGDALPDAVRVRAPFIPDFARVRGGALPDAARVRAPALPDAARGRTVAIEYDSTRGRASYSEPLRITSSLNDSVAEFNRQLNSLSKTIEKVPVYAERYGASIDSITEKFSKITGDLGKISDDIRRIRSSGSFSESFGRFSLPSLGGGGGYSGGIGGVPRLIGGGGGGNIFGGGGGDGGIPRIGYTPGASPEVPRVGYTPYSDIIDIQAREIFPKETILEKLRNIFNSIKNSIVNTFDDVLRSFAGTSLLGGLLPEGGFGSMFENFKTQVIDGFKTFSNTFVGKIFVGVLRFLTSTVFAGIMATIDGVMVGFFEKDDATLTAMFNTESEKINLRQRITGFLGGFFGNILGFIPDALIRIGTFLSNKILGTEFNYEFGDFMKLITIGAGKIFGMVIGALAGDDKLVAQSVGMEYAAIRDKFTNALVDIKNFFIDHINRITEGLVDSLPTGDFQFLKDQKARIKSAISISRADKPIVSATERMQEYLGNAPKDAFSVDYSTAPIAPPIPVPDLGIWNPGNQTASMIARGLTKGDSLGRTAAPGFGGFAPDETGREGWLRVYSAAAAAGDKFPEITASQWALESGWGKRMPADSNNPFGIKARVRGGVPIEPYVNASSPEVENGKEVTRVSPFRKYESIDEAIRDRVARWSPRYASATSVEDALVMLGKTGYATDPNYIAKLSSILKNQTGLGVPTVSASSSQVQGDRTASINFNQQSEDKTLRSTVQTVQVKIPLTREEEEYYARAIKEYDEDKKYRDEKAALEKKFYGDLENMIRPAVQALQGPAGTMGLVENAGRSITRGMTQEFSRLGTTLFGKQYGAAMGSTFQQLAGVYLDQFIDQALAPALGISKDMLNRSINTYMMGREQLKGPIEAANKALDVAKTALSTAEKEKGVSSAEVVRASGLGKSFTSEQLSRIANLERLRGDVKAREEAANKLRDQRRQYNQAAFEDLFSGMTGVPIGMRNMVEAYGGTERLTGDLASLAGQPLSPMFRLANNGPAIDPRIELQSRLAQTQEETITRFYDASGRLVEEMRTTVAGAFKSQVEAAGPVLRESVASAAPAIASSVQAGVSQALQGMQSGSFATGGGGVTGALTRALDETGIPYMTESVSKAIEKFDTTTEFALANMEPAGSGTYIPPSDDGSIDRAEMARFRRQSAAGGLGGYSNVEAGMRNQRLMGFGQSMLGNMATNFIGSKLGVRQGTFGGQIYNRMSSDLMGSMMRGGNFDFMQSLGGSLGIKLAPGAGLSDLFSGFNTMVGNMNPMMHMSKLGMQGLQALMPGGATGPMGQFGFDFFSGMGSGGNFISNMGSALSSGGSFMGSFGANAAGTGMNMGNFMGQAAGALGPIMQGMQYGDIAKNLIGGQYKVSSGLDTFYKVGSAVASAVMGPIGGAIVGAVSGGINRLFGRKPKETKASGFTGTLSAEGANLQQFTDYFQKGGVFRSNKSWTEKTALDAETAKAFDETVTGITKSVKGMARAFGLSTDAVNGFTQEIKVDLKGKSEAEQQKLLQEAFQKFGAGMVGANYASVTQFSKAGEDALETFERLASAKSTFESTITGLDISKLFNIPKVGDVKPGEPAAGSVAGLFGSNGAGWFRSIVPRIVESIIPNFDDLGQTIGDAVAAPLEEIVKYTASDIKLMAANFQSELIAAYGGEEIFKKTEEALFDMLYTPEQKQAKIAEMTARTMTDTIDEFKDIGVTLPGVQTTFEQNRAMIEALLTQAEKDQKEGKITTKRFAEIRMAALTFLQAAKTNSEVTKNLGDALKEPFDIDNYLPVLDAYGQMVSRASNTVSSGVQSAANTITSGAQNAANTTTTSTNNLSGQISIASNTVQNAATSQANSISQLTTTIGTLNGSIQELSAGAGGVGESASSAASAAGSAAAAAASVGASVSGAVSSAVTGLDSVAAALGLGPNAVSSAVSAVSSAVSGAVSAAATAIGNVADAVAEAIGLGPNSVSNAVASISEAVSNAVDSISDAIGLSSNNSDNAAEGGNTAAGAAAASAAVGSVGANAAGMGDAAASSASDGGTAADGGSSAGDGSGVGDGSGGVYARGGRFSGRKPMIVGEVGPEIIMPGFGGSVVPTHKIVEAMNSSRILDSATRDAFVRYAGRDNEIELKIKPTENFSTNAYLAMQKERGMIENERNNNLQVTSAVIDNSVTTVSRPQTNIINSASSNDVRSSHPIVGFMTKSMIGGRMM